MNALPVTAMAIDMKASAAQSQGRHGIDAFMDHLASASTINFKPAGFAGSTALSTSLPLRKVTTKNESHAANNNTPAIPNATSHVNQAPVPTQASNPAPATSGAKQADPTTPSNAQAVSPTTNNALPLNQTAPAARVQFAASLGTGNTIQLGGAAQAAAINQLGLPIGASSTGGVPSDAAGAVTNQPAIPTTGVAQDQLALAGALAAQNQAVSSAINSATQQLASLGIAAANQAVPVVPVQKQLEALAAITQSKQPVAAPTVPAVATGASAVAPTPDTSGASATDANANSGSGTNPTPPGAAELNARIVAGANKLTGQPNVASSTAADSLLQAQEQSNPIASNPLLAAAPVGKSQPTTGHLPNAADLASSANANAVATDTTGDFRSLALGHSAAVAHNTASDINTDDVRPAPSATIDTNTSPSTTPPPPVQTNVQPNTAVSAPTDPSPRDGLLVVPASEQVAVHLKQALNNGSDEIQIQLKPASLGTIDVKLNVSHDGRLTAVISADRSDTLNLLKQDSSNLQQSLRDAGFNADSSSLSFNLRGDTQSFAQNSRQQGYGAGSGSSLVDDLGSPIDARTFRQHSGSIDIQA